MVLSTWLEDELKKRRQRQLDAAVKKAVGEAVEKAVGEGVEMGVEQERSRWQEWNDRREAASAAGQEFTELPPHYVPPPPY